MTTIAKLDGAISPTTDGEIAIINLESARRAASRRVITSRALDVAARASNLPELLFAIVVKYALRILVQQ